MEGFEKEYLLRKNGVPKMNFGYSRNSTFKDYFTKYSERLSSIIPKANVGTKTIMKNILQDEEMSTKELQSLRADIDKKLFTRKDKYLEWLEAQKNKGQNKGASPVENTPTNTEKSTPSLFRNDIPSTSWDGNEVESSVTCLTLDCDSEEETSCIVGNGNTRNTTAKQFTSKTTFNRPRVSVKTSRRKRSTKKASSSKTKRRKRKRTSKKTLSSEPKGPNLMDSKQIAHGDEINVSCAPTTVADDLIIASNSMNRSKTGITAKKTMKNPTQNIDPVGNVKFSKERNASLYDSCKISYQSKNCQKKANNKQVNPSRKFENKSKLMTKVLNDKNLPTPVKPTNVIEQQSYGNKLDLFSLLNEAISEDTQTSKKPLNKRSIETKTKIVSQSLQPFDTNPHHCSASSSAEIEEHVHSEAHELFNQATHKQENSESKNNSETRESCKESHSEAIEIVSQLLETMLLNIKSDSDCLVPQPDTIKYVSSSSSNLPPGDSQADSTPQVNFVSGSSDNVENLHNQCIEVSNEKELRSPSETTGIVSQILDTLTMNDKANLHDQFNEVSNEKELRSPSEATEIVSQILDALIINVDIMSSKESTNAINQSNLVPEGPVRRGARKRIKNKSFDYEEDCVKKFQAEQPQSSRSEPRIPEYGDGESADTRISSIIRSISRKNRAKNSRRYKSVRGTIIVNTTKQLGEKDLIPWKNFVLCFRIHKPFHRLVGKKGVRPGKCQQEIEVLNFQTLEDLRNKIACESDYQYVSGDISEWPYNPVTELAKEKYKGAMFYIKNTFYINTEVGAEDYSEVIREWAEGRGITVGETKPMNSIKVEDLELRHGYPYVYMHQGGCEHLIIVNRARLLMKKSSLHSSDYPNLTKISKSPVQYCITCTRKPARWIVSKSDMLIHDYNYMCDKCFHRYMYIKTEKNGDFKAWYYRQRALLFY